MADLRRLTDRYATIEIHVPRTAFDLLASSYAGNIGALKALRLALPGLCQVLVERRAADLEASARAREQSDRAAHRYR